MQEFYDKYKSEKVNSNVREKISLFQVIVTTGCFVFALESAQAVKTVRISFLPIVLLNNSFMITICTQIENCTNIGKRHFREDPNVELSDG